MTYAYLFRVYDVKRSVKNILLYFDCDPLTVDAIDNGKSTIQPERTDVSYRECLSPLDSNHAVTYCCYILLQLHTSYSRMWRSRSCLHNRST